MEKKNLIFTTDACIGCNKCIKGCPSIGANTAVESKDAKTSHIVVDGDKCIHCGNCLKNCEHNARRFTDDLADLLVDLKAGVPIVLLVAPSFFLDYPTQAKHILASFRRLGFKAIYDVSFGANITTWASLKYIRENQKYGMISSACPVIVDYIEKYKPSLIPNLLPIMSPVCCLMTYLKTFVYNSAEDANVRYAFFSPCVGKHDEYSSYPDGSRLDYSFTFKSYFEYCKDNDGNVVHYGESECDELVSPGMGKLYPVPGGLRSNLATLLSGRYYIKQIEGPHHVYDYLDTYEKMVKHNDQLPFFVDALNCEGGCSEGVAGSLSLAESEVMMTRFQSNLVEDYRVDPDKLQKYGSPADARWADLDECLSKKLGLEINMFMRSYNTQARVAERDVPDAAIDEIFKKMNKFTPESRCINCTSCGYSGCREMAQAIYYGYNTAENCVHYIKDTLMDSTHQMEKLLNTITGSTGTGSLVTTKTEQLVQQITNALLDVENQREELSNSIGERTQMFANLTHELRTPLNAIINMTDLLDTSNFNKEQLENIKSIKTASGGLMDTINEILDFSKMEAGKFIIVEDKYNLHELLFEVATVMNFRCIEKKLTFNRSFDHSIPDHLIGDYKRIRQVMVNLIGNAVKYTSLGSVSIYAKWNNDRENPVLTFSVTDTGMGIKEEDIPYLFDSYKQVNESETKHIVGTGLGLSISKNIVDAMGGNIRVESEYGTGSTFYLELPQKAVDFTTIGDVLKAPQEAPVTEDVNNDAFVIPSYKALVVDDLPVNLHVARSFLDKYQIYVDIAESGKEALSKCEAMKYDLIFMDHRMPEMSGLEAVRALQVGKGINADTPVIYMSANDEQTFVNEIAADMVFQGYIEKPVQKDALKNTLLALADPKAIIYDYEGYIPEKEDLENAVKQKDYGKYLELMAALERYAAIHDPGRTLRLANKYRIMLQLGLHQVPVNNLPVIEALCTMLRK